jgi:hypothetical protein
MTDYSRLFYSLQAHVGALEAKFIGPHLPLAAATPPDSYDLDVRAFCVLTHAGFEQFVEDVCVGLAHDASQVWLYNQSCSQPLMALLAFQRDRLPIEEDEAKPEISFFTHIRLASDDARAAFSTFLRTQNHGVSVKYLRHMLLSVGLDVPDNARWLGSLNKLAGQRGDLAHKSHVKKMPSPEDAKTWVRDCMEMFAKVREDAKLALQRPQFVEDHRHYTI